MVRQNASPNTSSITMPVLIRPGSAWAGLGLDAASVRGRRHEPDLGGCSRDCGAGPKSRARRRRACPRGRDRAIDHWACAACQWKQADGVRAGRRSACVTGSACSHDGGKLAASGGFWPMLFRVFALFGLSTLSLIALAQAETWTRYVNERFGTSVEVPAAFTAQPPAANTDGRTFVSKDGTARILVYGSNAPSVVVESFAAYRDWIAEAEAKDSLRISYRAN